MTTHRAHPIRAPRNRFFEFFETYFAPKNIFTAQDRKFRQNGWQILCTIVGAIVVCAVMKRLGRFDLSRPVCAIIGSLLAAMRLRWYLRRFAWFWLTLVVYVSLSTVLAAALTWSTKGPSRGIIGGIMGISVYALFVAMHAFESHTKARDLPAQGDQA